VTPTCLVARAGPCDAESASTKRTITYAGKHSAQPSPVSRLDAQKGYAGTPTIGNARSLWFPFHSPGAMGGESVWRRASTASPVQGRSELQAHGWFQAACATLPAHSSLQVARRYRADAISATTADPCYLMNPREYVKLRTYAPLFPFSAFPTSGLPTGTVPGSASGRSRPTHWSPDRKPVGNSAKRRSSSTSIGTASRGSNVQWPGSGRRCGRRSTGC